MYTCVSYRTVTPNYYSTEYKYHLLFSLSLSEFAVWILLAMACTKHPTLEADQAEGYTTTQHLGLGWNDSNQLYLKSVRKVSLSSMSHVRDGT